MYVASASFRKGSDIGVVAEYKAAVAEVLGDNPETPRK